MLKEVEGDTLIFRIRRGIWDVSPDRKVLHTLNLELDKLISSLYSYGQENFDIEV
ncbi:hypothetical protein HS7_01000 [Sulfolobales archaeon HS-7]|nr:hypothetical protein HS7_01000 [Sulfolobales archaeon HS-7]